MNRRTILFFLIIATALLLLAGAVAEEPEEDLIDKSGKWWYWYTVADGGATIEMLDEGFADDHLVIPDTVGGYPVTGIGVAAFSQHDFSRLTLPETVTSIGDSAFSRCIWLTELTIPAGVVHIGPDAFTDTGLTGFDVSPDNPVYEQIDGVLFLKQQNVLFACPSKKEGEYAVPEGALAIGDYAFKSCCNLKTVTIPDSVISIGDGAFNGCSGLTDIVIPDSVARIGFRALGIKGVLLHVREGGYAEQYAKDSGLQYALADLPAIQSDPGTAAALPAIADSEDRTDASGQWRYMLEDGGVVLTRYANNKQTGDLTIPGQVDGYPVTGIGDSAFFQFWNHTGIAFPDGLKTIGKFAFSNCRGLTEVTLPEGIVQIDDSAFKDCKNLTAITLPASVTSIGANPFIGCPLTQISVSADNPAYTAIDGVLFDKRDSAVVAFPGAREGAYAIPAGVTVIGPDAFRGCEGLTDILIPDGVTRIGDGAFYECGGLTDIVLPDSVTVIGAGAFSFCKGLARLTLPNGVTDIGRSAFSCSSLTHLTLPDSLTNIGDNAFNGCVNLTGIAIPDGLTRIGEGFFTECYDLTWVTISNSVTEIGSKAFYKCEKLADLTLPDSITQIGYKAFESCTKISLRVQAGSYAEEYAKDNGIRYTDVADRTEDMEGQIETDDSAEPDQSDITDASGRWKFDRIVGEATIMGCVEEPRGDLVIPGELDGYSVTAIGEYAFQDCRYITGVTIPDSVTRIGAEAFAICLSLTHVTIPDSVTSIGEWAFKDCIDLTGVTIGENVTSIGGLAFFACESLGGVMIPASVTDIGELAFGDCAAEFTLGVTLGSYAEQYAKENGIAYTITE